MNAIKDGGSAFPVVGMSQRNGQEFMAVFQGGMTLRDYFIAHAPVQPQEWFRPVMKIERPKPISKTDWSVMYDANACAAYDAEYQKARLIQWPSAWADAMLAEREAQP